MTEVPSDLYIAFISERNSKTSLGLTPEAYHPSYITITGTDMGEDLASDPATLSKRARGGASMNHGTVPFTIKDEPIENQRRMRVVIIGAGFSGIYTTVRLVSAERTCSCQGFNPDIWNAESPRDSGTSTCRYTSKMKRYPVSGEPLSFWPLT